MPFKKPVKKVQVKEEDYEQDMENVEEPYEEPEQPQKPSKKETWIVHDVPVESQKVIVNTKTKKVYDLYSAVVEILNRTE